ncbi:MAG TPA: hypothetical protein VNI01_10325 [Elusimicrobiota bacterium]|jgi:protein arginine kinase activator|nr:hypothetical protein [Elusimicrobiota bacterium]
MPCSRCGKAEAEVFFKQIVKSRVTELHLCGDCSASLDLLFGKAPSSAAPASCSACGRTWAEFQKYGLLGCPDCYDAFARPLEGVLRRVHGTSAPKQA